MKDNNKKNEKGQDGFHSLIKLDSSEWKVETDNEIEIYEKPTKIYEQEDYTEKGASSAKSVTKNRWIIIIFVSVIVFVGIFFAVKWREISSRENNLPLNVEEFYLKSDENDENTEGVVVDSTDVEKQEITTSKINGVISAIIGYGDKDVTGSEDYIEIVVTEPATKDVTENYITESGEEVTEEKTEAEEKTEKTTKEDGKKPTQHTSKKPSTTAEIVDYFNKAVNGVKTGAKSVKQHSIVNYLAAPTKIGDGLSGIYKMLGGDNWLDDMLQSNSIGEVTYTGADIKKNYPVENESWASKLTAADVKSATYTEANGVYTIKIVTKDDAKTTSVKHGQGHNPKVFSVVLPGTINENIPGIAKGITGEVAMSYPSGTATITVDAATGRVLTAVYNAYWTINFDMMATSIPFATKTTYSIYW